MKRILIFVGFFFLWGCGPTMMELVEKARVENRQKLTRLSVGMTKQEVLNIMGTETMILKSFDDVSLSTETKRINNPYRVEAVQAENGKTYEILFYYTDVHELDGVVTDDELTPLVIEDGKLIGWGWTFVDDNIKKYQIDMR